ncbi:MAG: hypothetical protein QNJ90_03920 [Planctomycetota bacterium]|nr:hypothetical protein [Planctomycetota bacterium]
MEACNLDRSGVTKRLVAGIVALVAGLAASAWMIQTGQPLLLRIAVAIAAFGFAGLSLFQARAKT